MLVTVVMATFNEPAPIVTKAIQSILHQSLTDLELIVIDDSTNDLTRAAIDAAAAADDRVQLVRRDERIGFVPALNIGLERAKGLYIARMDGDDMALADKLAVQVEFLEQHPEVTLVGSAIEIVDQHDKVRSERHYPLTQRAINRYSMLRSPVAHPTVLFRREVVDRGFRYDERLKRCEDLDLWLRLMNRGYRFANIDRPLLRYRVVGDLADKRKDDHWSANRKVRFANFSWRRPCWSLVSCGTALCFSLAPRRIVSYAYKKENK